MTDYTIEETLSRLRKHPVITMDKQNVTNDAANIIEQLLKQVPRWRPVNTEPPEIGEEVLVTYALTTTKNGKKYFTGEWAKPRKEFMFRKLGYPNQGDLMWTGHATHWMPLPSTPTSEEG